MLYKVESREPTYVSTAQHASIVCVHNRQSALLGYARLHHSTECVAS